MKIMSVELIRGSPKGAGFDSPGRCWPGVAFAQNLQCPNGARFVYLIRQFPFPGIPPRWGFPNSLMMVPRAGALGYRISPRLGLPCEKPKQERETVWSFGPPTVEHVRRHLTCPWGLNANRHAPRRDACYRTLNFRCATIYTRWVRVRSARIRLSAGSNQCRRAAREVRPGRAMHEQQTGERRFVQ